MFNRVDSNVYSYNFNDGVSKRKYLIKFKAGEVRNSPIFKDTEFKYNLTSKMVKDLLENKVSTYKLGGKTWQIKAEDQPSSLLSKIGKVFHQAGDDGIVRLEIVESSDDPFRSIKKVASALDEGDAEYVKNEASVFNRICAEEYEKSMGLIPLTLNERKGEIRGKVELSKAIMDENDPFTTLATVAFQKYETEFTGTDYLNPDQAQMCLQVIDNHLVLISRKEADLETDKNRACVQAFKNQLIQEYGEKKVAQIEHAYGIDLEKLRKKGKPLTPEIVYRINIGLTSTDVEDVSDFAAKLALLAIALEEGNKEEPFLISQAEKAGLTHREIRGMLLASNGDVVKWIGKVSSYPNLSNEAMGSIVGVFSHENQRLLTGRKIFYAIQTQYTLGDHKEYKPWIDQQELFQTFKLLKKPQTEASYHETLSFIVCKKHLLRKDSRKQYAVGAILPAPPDSLGTPRYYTVSKAVHNGFGGLYYELEPLGKDSGLAKIYLFRSTASTSYHFFSKESVSNDLNPLAQIGHEGVYRIEKEILPGIIDATIPVWVGYLEQLKASPLSNREECCLALSAAQKAFEELQKDQINKVPIYSFADLIKKHDFLLNDLRLLGGIDFIKFHALANRYVHSKSVPSKWEERADAEALLDTLLQFSTTLSTLPIEPQAKTRLNSALVDFAREVSSHVLTDASIKARAAHLDRFYEENAVVSIGQKLSELTESMDLNELQSSLEEIQKVLTKISLHLGEDLSQKRPQNLTFTGHSLGAGMSQIYSSKFVFNQNRIPCPNQKVSIHEFDGPGGSFEDNQKFKNLILKHGDLLQDLNSGIEIYHQHEVGDPVPNTGIHLGAADSMAEAALLMKKCDIKVELFKRLIDAKNPNVAQSKLAHETQFLKGEEGVDYTKTSLDPYSLGLFDFCEVMQDVLPEKLKKKGIHLRDHVWQLSWIGRGTGENLRVSPLLDPIRHFFREKDSRFKELSDSNGNFIIDSEGLRIPSEIRLDHTFQKQESSDEISAMAQEILFAKPGYNKIPWLGAKLPGAGHVVEDKQRRHMVELAGGVRKSLEVESGIALDTMYLSVESFANQLKSMNATYCRVRVSEHQDPISAIFVTSIASINNLYWGLQLKSSGIQMIDYEGGKILFPSQNQPVNIIGVELSNRKVEASSQATVVIVGGLLAKYEYYADEAAAFLMNGMNVFFYNPRGYGASGGKSSEETFDHDLAFICDYLRMEKRIPSDKILLKGSCLGGALAARAANRKENKEVHVMLDQTFADLKSISQSMAEDFVGKNLAKVVSVAAKMVFPNYKTYEEIAKMKNNLCMIVNEDDKLIPSSEKNVGSLHTEGGHQQLVMLRGIEHTGSWFSPGTLELKPEKGNRLGKEQVESFLDNIHLRKNLFEPSENIIDIMHWKVGKEKEEWIPMLEFVQPIPIEPHTYSQATLPFQEILAKVNQVSVNLRKQGSTATAPIFLNLEQASIKDVHTVAILKHASESGASVKRQAEKWFKALPFAQETLGMRRPTTLLPGGISESKAFGEVQAYRLSQFLGSRTVPETHFVHLYSDHHLEVAKPNAPQDAAFTTVQQFADPGFKDAREHLKEDIENKKVFKFEGSIRLGSKKSHITLPANEHCFTNDTDNFTQEGLQRFQECAVDSYIFGGLDCHLGNLLSKKDHEGRYADFLLIDNGISFFMNFPEEKDKLILNNYCGWIVHPLSSEPLTKETKRYIDSIEPDRVIKFFLQQKEAARGFCFVNGKDHTDTYFNDQMILNTLIRIQVLKKLASQSQGRFDLAVNNQLPLNSKERKVLDKLINKEITLEKLSELKTENQIINFLGIETEKIVNSYNELLQKAIHK